MNIEKHHIESLLKFHFNDGTSNGSGINRKSADDFINENFSIVASLNNILNSPQIKEKIIDRVLFKSEYYHIPEVDYIYYGHLEKGLYQLFFL